MGSIASFIANYKTLNPWKINAIDSTYGLVTSRAAKFSKILDRFMITSGINKLLANEMKIHSDDDYSTLVARKKRDKLAGLLERRSAIQK